MMKNYFLGGQLLLSVLGVVYLELSFCVSSVVCVIENLKDILKSKKAMEQLLAITIIIIIIQTTDSTLK